MGLPIGLVKKSVDFAPRECGSDHFSAALVFSTQGTVKEEGWLNSFRTAVPFWGQTT